MLLCIWKVVFRSSLKGKISIVYTILVWFQELQQTNSMIDLNSLIHADPPALPQTSSTASLPASVDGTYVHLLYVPSCSSAAYRIFICGASYSSGDQRVSPGAAATRSVESSVSWLNHQVNGVGNVRSASYDSDYLADAEPISLTQT